MAAPARWPTSQLRSCYISMASGRLSYLTRSKHATRGEAYSGVSRAVDTIGQRYRTLDLELDRVMATGVRPIFPALRSGVGASSIASQSSDSGAYSISSTGLGREQHQNVGSSRGAGGSSNGSAPAASDTQGLYVRLYIHDTAAESPQYLRSRSFEPLVQTTRTRAVGT